MTSKPFRVLLSVLLSCLLFSGFVRGDWSDDFESYAVDSDIGGQGIWTTWDLNPDVSAAVTDEEALGEKSMLLQSDDDMIPVFEEDAQSGCWVLTVWVYIPAEAIGSAWLALMYECEPDVSNYQFLAGDVTVGYLDDGMPGIKILDATISIDTDEWIEIQWRLDMDNNNGNLYVNGERTVVNFALNGAPNQLAGMDVWTGPGNGPFYIDDMSLQPAADCPGMAPEITGFPEDEEDFYFEGAEVYTRTLSIRGIPTPTVEILEPAAGAELIDGVLTVDLAQVPEEFAVTLKAVNDLQEEALVGWTVSMKTRELLGAWCFEEGEGTVAYDYTGGFDGFFENSPQWITPGQVGSLGAIHVSGGNRIRCGPGISDQPDLTLAFWINPDQLAHAEPITLSDGNYGTRGWRVMMRQEGGVWFRIHTTEEGPWNQGDIWIEPDVFTYTPGVWYHMAFTFDSTTREVRVYCDGDLMGSKILASTITTAANMDEQLVFNESFSCKLDDVQIYNYPLAEDEILDLLEESVCPPPSDEPPVFTSVPDPEAGDIYYAGGTYRRTVAFTGFPVPTLTVIEPDDAFIENNDTVVCPPLDPAPDTFTVTVQIDNGVGDPVQTSWPVSKVEVGLQGLWCLEEEDNGDVAYDALGRNDATLVGGPDWNEGYPSGDAVWLDGIDDWVILDDGADPHYDCHKDFTWSAWVLPAFNIAGVIFSKSISDISWDDIRNRGAMVLVLNSAGTLYFDCGWVGACGCSTCANLFDEQWHHVAVTCEFNFDGTDNDRVTIYVDGVEDGSRSDWNLQIWSENGTVDGAVGDLKAGYSTADFPRDQSTCFDGAIDKISVWNVALTPSEISELYENPDELCDANADTINVHVGDPNADGSINLADAITVLSYLFSGSEAYPCMKAGDVNDDDSINLADAVNILSYLFSSGAMTDPEGGVIEAGGGGCIAYPADAVVDMGCETPCSAR